MLPATATMLARTLRIEWRGTPLPARAVVMFWHGKMFAGWYLVRQHRPVGLVSPSKDGSYLTAVLARWKYNIVRGSTTRGGVAALDEAIECVHSGKCDSIVVTPDGPRGPRHQFRRGAFVAASRLALPLYFVDIRMHPKRVLKSWDKFEVPLPFSRVIATVHEVNVEGLPSEPRQQYEWIAQQSANLPQVIFND